MHSAMKHLVLGTAGHVDHGKTALVKALTGVDTDRLKVEKERGITVDLGFAPLALPGGMVLSVVDVPGHERFIRNMLSGASGIDLVLLVIAADEGVMPQTREHLHICTYLGIRRGLVALTKVDLVEADWLALVEEDVRAFLQGTFLEGAPVVPVSALTGEGLPVLREALAAGASAVEEEEDPGLFRLPVDRVFSMKGFGTVVTGTLLSGGVRNGETVEIFPGGGIAKIRGIQVHRQAVAAAEAGQRAAVNLQGVERTSLGRGQVLARQESLQASRRIDVRISALGGMDKALKNRSLVRLHAGTSETICRLVLLDTEELSPGASAFAQCVSEAPLAVMAGDRFVIRSYSPVTTVGGGLVLDPLPGKHRRLQPSVLAALHTLCAGTTEEKTAVILDRAGLEGITPTRLVLRTGRHAEELRRILDVLLERREAVLLEGEDLRVVSGAVFSRCRERILAEVRSYHARFPLREGMPKGELRAILGYGAGPKLLAALLRDLEAAGDLVSDGEHVRVPGHQVSLSGEMDDLREQVLALYRQADLAVPSLREVEERFPGRRDALRNVLSVMVREGGLVKVAEDLLVERGCLERLQASYRDHLAREGRATPASFRDLTGLTRKYIIPFLEYFDRVKLTLRSGDCRVLREKR